MTKEIKTVVNRVVAPTPVWFKRLRNIGIAMGAIGAVILSAPVSFPSAIITAAGYLAVAGGIMSAVSQTAVK